MSVLTRAHESFYREELPPAENSHILVQPENRGTGVAITAAILRIMRSDIDAIVALFPCDHYYTDDDAFALTIRFGRAKPFLELLCAEIPDVVSNIAAALTDKDLDSAYRGVRTVDFSHAVLVPTSSIARGPRRRLRMD